MKMAIVLALFTITACGSGGFNAGTKTENNPRRVVEAGDMQAADDANLNDPAKKEGADSSEKNGDGSSKSGAKDGLCGYDQATIDALIASGQPFEVECEIEVGEDD